MKYSRRCDLIENPKAHPRTASNILNTGTTKLFNISPMLLHVKRPIQKGLILAQNRKAQLLIILEDNKVYFNFSLCHLYIKIINAFINHFKEKLNYIIKKKKMKAYLGIVSLVLI